MSWLGHSVGDVTNKIDHTYTREIVCPYCGYEFADSVGYALIETPYEIECEDCLKTFEAHIEIETTYVTNKIKELLIP